MTHISTVSPFLADSPMTKAMAHGHYNRLGHHLTGYYVPAGDGTAKLIRTCCEEHK